MEIKVAIQLLMGTVAVAYLVFSVYFITPVFTLTCPSEYALKCEYCRGNPSLCNKGTLTGATESSCENALLESDVISVHWYPEQSMCARYTCYGNTYATTGVRTQMWHTSIADCRLFTISEAQDRYVTEPDEYVATSIEKGDCFELCFRTQGCYMFYHDNSAKECKLYTSCGVACSTSAGGNIEKRVYTRNCDDACPTLTNSATYQVSVSCGRSFGDMAEYSCLDGYVLTSGATLTTCQSDTTWSDPPPVCSQVDCGPPPTTITNGNVLLPIVTMYPTNVTYSCNSGYIPSGTAYITCQSDSTWSSSTVPLTCTATDCGPAPTEPAHGSVTTPQGTTFPNNATYSCDLGYDLFGASSIMCTEDGIWSNSAPECRPVDCLSLPDPNYGTVNTSTGTTFEQTAVYNCDLGYFMYNGSTTRECQSNAEWDGTEPTCSTVDCLTPESPEYGSVCTPTGTVFNQVAYYNCSYGYALTGNSERTCLYTAEWSNDDPVCNFIDCGQPDVPVNGSVQTQMGTLYEQEAMYNCSIGYVLSGQSQRTCQYNSTWSGTNPLCNIVNCGNLSNPDQGFVSVPSTEYQQTASYTCKTGYLLNGNNHRVCEHDGYWNGSQPTCDIVDCGNLSPPNLGSVDTVNGTVYLMTGIYLCVEGYQINGSLNTTCQANGNWSNPRPICSIVDCGVPQSSVNGNVTFINGTTYLSQIIFMCEPGYTVSGITTATCLSTGYWNMAVPSCNIVDCGLLANPVNGNVLSSVTTYGQNATFTCDVGYILNSSSIVNCDTTGLWNPTPPGCNQVDCGVLNDPSSGNVTLVGGSTYGAFAYFSCDVGYHLSHVQNRTCTLAAVWTYTQPVCVPDDSPVGYSGISSWLFASESPTTNWLVVGGWGFNFLLILV